MFKQLKNDYIELHGSPEEYVERGLELGPKWEVNGVSRDGVLLTVYDVGGNAITDREVSWTEFETEFCTKAMLRTEAFRAVVAPLKAVSK